MKYLVENNGTLSSALVPISLLDADKKNTDFVEAALNKLAASSEVGKLVVDNYRQQKAEQQALRDRVKEGMPAPDFTFQNTCLSTSGPLGVVLAVRKYLM